MIKNLEQKLKHIKSKKDFQGEIKINFRHFQRCFQKAFNCHKLLRPESAPLSFELFKLNSL